MCNGNKMCGGCVVHKTSGILVLIGGLNWGLVGLGMLMGSNLNVINLILGQWPMIEAVVYLLVGIATIMVIFGCKCKKCMEACGMEGKDEKMGGMDKKMEGKM